MLTAVAGFEQPEHSVNLTAAELAGSAGCVHLLLYDAPSSTSRPTRVDGRPNLAHIPPSTNTQPKPNSVFAPEAEYPDDIWAYSFSRDCRSGTQGLGGPSYCRCVSCLHFNIHRRVLCDHTLAKRPHVS